MGSVWDFEICKRNVIIILVGVVMNYLLYFATKQFQLPFWLDASGTAYAALALGPVYGLIAGLLYTILLTCLGQGTNSLWYVWLISACLAVFIGVLNRKRLIRDFLDVCGVVFLCCLINVLAFTALALFLNQGVPGDRFGRVIFDAMRGEGSFAWFSSATSVLVGKFLDTVICAAIVGIAYFLTPKDRYYY